MQIQQSVIESTYYDATDFSTVSRKLLQIRDGVFGFQRQITNGKIINQVIAPFYFKSELNQSNLKIPIFSQKSQENTHFYHVLLKNNDLFPIFLSKYNCLFDDLYLANEHDEITLQLLIKYDSSNWQEKAIDQNDCYLYGVENPSKNKFGQLLQTKIISFLDKVSNQNSEHEVNQFIENKILEQGYLCELRVIIQSDNPEPTLTYIQDILNHYTHLNSLVIYEDKQVFNLADFTLSTNNFHLSESEVISLIHNPIQPVPLSTPSQLSNLANQDEQKIEDHHINVCASLQKALRQVGLITPKQRLNQLHELTGHNMKLITVSIPKGTTFTQYANKITDISAALGEDISVIPGNEPNSMTLLFPRKQRQIVTLDELIQTESFKQYAQSHILPFVAGLNIYDKPIYEDLALSPHLLISGATLSGKSVFMNCLITTLLKVKKQNELKIKIIDPKMVEFKNEYSDYTNVEVITDMKLALKEFHSLVDEMERRYLLLSTHNCKNVQEYNVKYAPIPYIVCVIDEYYDLYLQDKNVEEVIARLGQKARAAGIHLIVATQRPDASVISGVIKANLTSKISFHLGSNKDYMTVFGRGIPYKLMNNGDGVMNWMTEQEEFIRFQSPIILDQLEDQDHLTRLKQIIAETGETRLRELQQLMGIRINDVSRLLKELVDDGYLYKNNKGYQILESEDVQD